MGDVGQRGEWDELIAAAKQASEHAYAPYSQLRVGAALESDRGDVYAAGNVENASYGLTICAERAAVFQAVAGGARGLRRLVIYTPGAGPLTPCGACRQVLAEFARALSIVSVGGGGLRREFDLADLLPHPFGWPAGDPTEGREV